MTEQICEAGPENIPALVKMALDFWPENTAADLTRSFLESLSSGREKHFLYKIDDAYVGFIMVSIRQDYVEGCNSKPVGYIEGIYVDPAYRKKGIARRLVERGEEWARMQGCREMGSDTELTNEASLRFHLGVGFREANRVICFIKEIK